MTPVQTVQTSKRLIEEAAAFAFQGAPRAYMETEFGFNDESLFQRWVYVVYGYGYRGEKSNRALTQLTTGIVKGIHSLDAGRVAVVWRRYPQSYYDADTDTNYASVRLAVVDENLRQLSLELPSLTEEGLPYPMLSDDE